MRPLPFFIIFVFLISTIYGYGFHGHAPRDYSKPRPRRVFNPLPRGPVPSQWTWGDVNGINYLTQTKNQHLPQYCGSCWAQAATSSLSDRIKIARKAAWPDINIAPQVLISCGPGDGCHGGDAEEANEWMAKYGITDETCSIYTARGHDNGAPCTRTEICETCWPGANNCQIPTKYLKYAADEYAPVEGADPAIQEENMRKEIFHRGPISCGISVTEELYKRYRGGIFNDTTGALNINHDISVVGFGEENGVKFWIIRNSWGTYWGEKGFFRLIRGVNNLGIESGTCSWATPLNTWGNTTFIGNEPIKSVSPSIQTQPQSTPDKIWDIIDDFIKRIQNKRYRPCRAHESRFTNGPVIKSHLPQDTVADNDLPKSWDWRNAKGHNYLSWTVNQHIPQYCGSCWAQGTLSALADRFIIANRTKYANLGLSAQYIINCRAGGSCEGGNPAKVYEFAKTVGIPDMTCQVYEAKDNGPVHDCSKPDLLVCRDCTWPPPPPGDSGNCWARKDFDRYYTDEYGPVYGAANMKKEIWARGPIGCGVSVTKKFEDYSGGIYSEKVRDPFINHEISLVGWGVDSATGKEYWIGRNSWGTYWGEMGFFRIAMYEDNLGIETNCVWATPRL